MLFQWGMQRTNTSQSNTKGCWLAKNYSRIHCNCIPCWLLGCTL